MRCFLCDQPNAQTHHRKLRKQGGGDEPENTIPLCVACHIPVVHSNPRWAKSYGLLLPPWVGPVDYPPIRPPNRNPAEGLLGPYHGEFTIG